METPAPPSPPPQSYAAENSLQIPTAGSHAHVNPDAPPWGLGAGVLVWLASGFLMLVLQMGFLIPYASSRGIGMAELEEFTLNDPTAIFLLVISILPAHLLTLGLAWLLVTRGGKFPFLESLGWTWDAKFNFAKSAGLAVVLLGLGLGLIQLAGGPETQMDRIISSSRMTAVAMAFVATFTAPLVEEVVYRGVLYSSLRRVAGPIPAVAFVVLLFALVHIPQYWPNYGVISAILMLSFFLTVIRAYTGKLLPCFVIHLIFNGIQSLFIVLAPYLQRAAPEQKETVVGLLQPLLRLAGMGF